MARSQDTANSGRCTSTAPHRVALPPWQSPKSNSQQLVKNAREDITYLEHGTISARVIVAVARIRWALDLSRYVPAAIRMRTMHRAAVLATLFVLSSSLTPVCCWTWRSDQQQALAVTVSQQQQYRQVQEARTHRKMLASSLDQHIIARSQAYVMQVGTQPFLWQSAQHGLVLSCSNVHVGGGYTALTSSLCAVQHPTTSVSPAADPRCVLPPRPYAPLPLQLHAPASLPASTICVTSSSLGIRCVGTSICCRFTRHD